MFIRSCIILVVSLTIIAMPRAFGWGSIRGFNTHGHIAAMAFQQLGHDPILEYIPFPTIEEILTREGNGLDSNGLPTGPDTEGFSRYSEHYYNPLLQEGDAPKSVANHFQQMVLGRISGNRAVEIRSTAWAAHYLSDMSVPFHVIGVSADTLDEYFSSIDEGQPVPLPEDVTGDPEAMSVHVMTAPTEYRREVARYFDSLTEENRVNWNWFDPWYWNGTYPTTVIESSHIRWEGMISHNTNYTRSGYSPFWKNGTPTFEEPWKAQSEQAAKMAKAVAAHTQRNHVRYIENTQDPRDDAIQSVHTLWRASYSALFTDFNVFAVGENNSVSKFQIQGLVLNLAKEMAENVKLKISVKGGSIVSGTPIQTVGDIEQNERLERYPVWEVAVTSSKCIVRIEVIGGFSETPDLQYNLMERLIKGADDVTGGVSSFQVKWNYEVKGDLGSSHVGVENIGDVSQPGVPLTYNGSKLIYSQQDDVQTSAVNIVLNSAGTVITKMELSNRYKEIFPSGEFYTDSNLVFRDIPLRYSLHFGGGIYFYGFWLLKDQLSSHLVYSNFNGGGHTISYDIDGNEIRENLALQVTDKLWDQSMIYVELINKTQPEINSLLEQGKVTQEQIQKSLKVWRSEINKHVRL